MSSELKAYSIRELDVNAEVNGIKKLTADPRIWIDLHRPE